MLDHVGLGVSDLKRALKFYDPVMHALGHERLLGSEGEGFIAYGENEVGCFVINTPLEPMQGPVTPSNGSHFCFTAKTSTEVDAFHKAALKHGGKDAGKPGLRPDYGADYYCAFVRDPDGHKLEAVARLTPSA